MLGRTQKQAILLDSILDGSFISSFIFVRLNLLGLSLSLALNAGVLCISDRPSLFGKPLAGEVGQAALGP